MKKTQNNFLFIVLRVIFDAISVPIILTFAYSIKFKMGWIFRKVFALQIGEVYGSAQIEPYFHSIGILIILWTLSFYFSGVYNRFSGIMPEVDEAIKLVKGILLASILIMAMTFFYPIIPGSKFVIIYSAIFAFFWLMLGRLILNGFEGKRLRQGIGAKRTMIIGTNMAGQDVVEKMFLNPFIRYFYVGHIDDAPPKKLHYHLQNKFVYLGQISDIERVCIEQDITSIFLTTELKKKPLNALIIFCEKHNIEFNQLVESSSFMTGSVQVENFDGLPFISHKKLPDYNYEQKVKRIFDFCVALVSLLLISPIFIVIGILIKLVSPSGPIFYKQERVKQNGNTFNMIKFRTMIPDAEASGPVFVSEKGDDRYIPFGRFLRKYSLDELPQLFNIVKGDMSLVGPRPERPYFVDQFVESMPYYPLRHRLPVGLTGWAQINGRSVLTKRPEHKVKYDLYYVKNWTLVFDIKIILKTIFMVLEGEEAY